MTYTVLVPFDGSPTAHRAIPYAAALAKLHPSPRLVLLTVFVPTLYGQIDGWQPDAETERAATRELEQVAALAREAGVPDIAVRTATGVTEAREILRAAEDIGADAIALGTHGRGGLSRALLGSVAMAVATRSSIPCLLVPPGSPVGHAEIARAVLTTDGSDAAAAAIPVAQDLARHGVHVDVVEVVDPSAKLLAFTIPAADEGFVPQRIMRELLPPARARVRQIAGQFPSGTADGVVVRGRASAAITRYVHTHDIDLIVMASHGRTGASRLWWGSVADRVIRSARVPVLLVRSSDQGTA
ncbi:MAG TPA: universal stress protein [Dehalococcoidia bacterium]|nr:universal stress protein [Dehalococcoidia bacterium]